MAGLTAEIKVRLEPELKAELEARAGLTDRTAGALVRSYVREGLKRDLQASRRRGRGR